MRSTILKLSFIALLFSNSVWAQETQVSAEEAAKIETKKKVRILIDYWQYGPIRPDELRFVAFAEEKGRCINDALFRPKDATFVLTYFDIILNWLPHSVMFHSITPFVS